MGHKISKEQIDPSVKDYIMSFVGDVDDLETEVKSDIISAVNSLIVDRVDNIENMGKLAEAIGEPVTASDSVDEVVEKVDGLVANFKSKVLNAGIMYDSEDRFKQLIEKLEGLVAGEGGNSGIQFAEGEYEDFNMNGSTGEYVFTPTYDLNFTPSILFVKFNSINDNSGQTVTHIAISNKANGQILIGSNYLQYGMRDITNTEFSMTFRSQYNPYVTFRGITWYAIGVGEGQEDNTLLETLKGILEDEGIELTGEETMADLIGKVDQEFDKYNKGYYSFISGDDITLFSKSTSYTYGGLSTNKTWDLCERYDCIFNGTVKITLQNVETNFHYYTIYQYNSKGNLINTITSTNYEYSTSEFINDINVSEGDYINAIITYTNGSGQGRTYCDIKCSLK